MLGFALHRVLHDTGWEVTGTVRGPSPPANRWCRGLSYHGGVDVEDWSSVICALERNRPAVVINAVAATKFEVVAGDIARALAVNSMFPRRLDSVAGPLGFYLIHFSSDGVFSGRSGNCDERCLPDATDLYGMSKYLGEPVGARSLVLRTSIVGLGLGGGRSLLDWVLRQRGTIRGFRRAIFSGLPANEIASIIGGRILPREPLLTGLYNLSSDPISKFELLELVRAAWRMDDLRILPEDEPVVDRSLDSRVIRSSLHYRPPAWPDLVSGMREFYAGLDGWGPAT